MPYKHGMVEVTCSSKLEARSIWKLCQNYNLQCSETWYDHSPEAVMENDQVSWFWDFRIKKNHHLDHKRPDIVVLEKESRVCQIIDVVCPFDTRIADKKKRTREGRPLLGLKKSETTSKMWSCKRVSVIPVVIWALGAVTKNLMMWVTKTRTPGILNLLQAPVVQTLDSAIHRINHYPADKY